MECTCTDGGQGSLLKECTCTLAMAAVPCQELDLMYEPREALRQGTAFPELNLPFFKGGESLGQ